MNTNKKTIMALAMVLVMLAVPLTVMDQSETIDAASVVPTPKDYAYMVTYYTADDEVDEVQHYQSEIKAIYKDANIAAATTAEDPVRYANNDWTLDQGSWSWDRETGLGPFNMFYAAISTGVVDDRALNYDASTETNPAGKVAYILDPYDLTHALKFRYGDGSYDMSNYNIMLIIPTVYWYSDANGNLYISNTNTNSYLSDVNSNMKAYAHTADTDADGDISDETPYPYLAIGVYEATETSDKLSSVTGQTPKHSAKIDTMRGELDISVSAYGTYQIWNLYEWTLYKILAQTVIGSKDAQAVIGYGNDAYSSQSAPQTTGLGDEVGPYASSKTVRTKDGGYSKLFIENAWGSAWEFVDNTYLKNGALYAGTALTNTLSSSNANVNGYEYVPTDVRLSVPVSMSKTDIRGQSLAPETWDVPTSGTGSNTTPVGASSDSIWTNNGQNSCLFVGGYWLDGASDGLSAWASCNVLSHSYPNVGARLAYLMTADAAVANSEYTISFNEGDRLTSILNTSKVAITLPVPAPVSGYTFAGWYSDSAKTEYVGPAGSYYIPESSFVTLYAKFVADATITMSDGTASIGSFKAAVGSVISLPEAPGVADKILENWYATHSGDIFTNQLGPAGSSYTVTADATIYAKYVDVQSVWSVPVYKTEDGSSYSVDYTAAIPKGQTMVLPAAASISDYTFDGWYKGTSGALTTYVGMAGEGYVPTDASTLAPKYTAVTAATITFSANSSTVQTISSSVGSVITLPDGPGVTGKLFAGWYAEASCTTFEGYAGAPFSVTGTSTLFAKYVVGGGGGGLNFYTVSKDDGSSAKVTMTYTPTVMSGSFSLVYVVPDAGYVVTGVTDTASHSTITKLTDSIYMVSGATDDVSLSASAAAKTVSGVKDLYTLGFSENNGKIGVNVTPDAGKVLPKFKVTANSVEYQIVTVNGKSVTGYKNVTASAEVDAGSEGYSGLLGTGLESGYTLYGTYVTYSEWDESEYVEKQSTVQILAPVQI